ncbi:aspartate aminotransferase family protein [Roseateles sp. BYS180W]|uniref:Aspartate aminotransferase family protein n=1 Tax=Roseateles rivi TaxID=3299028 RepID=A0ABW7FZC9_9BURK
MSQLTPTPAAAYAASRAQSRSTRQWQQADSAHFLHPFTDHAALARKGARIITRAEGIYLWDSEGHKILDAMSGLWCVNTGYGQQGLVDAATRQMQELPFYNAFFQTSTPPAIELAELLAEVTPPQFDKVFFTCSGSEGNDTVVRMVRHYWASLGQPQRRILISRHNGYHGSTMAGASLGGMSGMHAQGGLPIPDIHHIQQPHWFEHGQGQSREDFGLTAAHWLEDKILELGPERVAAFIGEPVQGAGGVIVPPSTYWPEIQRICDKYGILLVSDEVICGFGRTGQWFGCETMGTRPDLMTFAKGVTSGYVPLGGVMVSQRVSDVLASHGEFNHGFTYSGHPVACAVATANIRLIQQMNLVAHVRQNIGPYLAQRLQDVAAHPLVGEVQSCAMMAAVQLVQDKAKLQCFKPELEVGMLCRAHCFGNGLIMRAVGDRMIIAPPLVMSRAQVDEMVNLILHCLDLSLQELQQKGWV